MGAPLPPLTEQEFRDRLAPFLSTARRPAAGSDPSLSPRPVDPALAATLYPHYLELRRWNPRLSLVGPGTATAVVERHYGESLAAVALLLPADRTVVDVGSGAGFPGLVLAAAVRELAVTLVEPKERKWTFLLTAARRCGLSCRCLNARVDRTLPAGLPDRIDLVTCRALALSPLQIELFHRHSPRVRFLLWHGKALPDLPAGCAVRREVQLAGSEHRRLSEVVFT